MWPAHMPVPTDHKDFGKLTWRLVLADRMTLVALIAWALDLQVVFFGEGDIEPSKEHAIELARQACRSNFLSQVLSSVSSWFQTSNSPWQIAS